MPINSIHWFRKGLRLHDNPALLEAVQGADTLRCVYFLDPWFAGSSSVGVNRWRCVLYFVTAFCSGPSLGDNAQSEGYHASQ